MDCEKNISTTCLNYDGPAINGRQDQDVYTWLSILIANAHATQQASQVSAQGSTFLSRTGDGKPNSPLSWSLLVNDFSLEIWNVIETNSILLERLKSILIGVSTRNLNLAGVAPVRQKDVTVHDLGGYTFRAQWFNQASGDTYHIQTAKLSENPKNWQTLFNGYPAQFTGNSRVKVDIFAQEDTLWRVRRKDSHGNWSDWSEQRPLITQ